RRGDRLCRLQPLRARYRRQVVPVCRRLEPRAEDLAGRDGDDPDGQCADDRPDRGRWSIHPAGRKGLMPSPERRGGLPHPEREPTPYCRAASFASEPPAAQAYNQIQDLLFVERNADVSVYRLLMESVSHVIVLG